MTAILEISNALSVILCSECTHSSGCAYRGEYGGMCWKKRAIMNILKEIEQ